MLNHRSRLLLKWLVPIFVLLLGCGMTNRLSSLIKMPASLPREETAVVQLPSATVSAAQPTEEKLAMVTVVSPVPSPTPAKTASPAVMATATMGATVPVSPTLKPPPTPTPTPEPTPGPYDFYLNVYQPKCAEGDPKAEVRVVDHQGQAMGDVVVELLNGLATPVATGTTDAEGRVSLSVGELASQGWAVSVSDESGGGALGRSAKVTRADLGCEPPYSVEIQFQKNVPKDDVTDWPERQPISLDYPPRTQKEGPWSSSHVRPLSDWPRPPHDNGMGIHFLPIGYYADWVVDLLIEHMKEMHMTWCVVLYNDDLALRITAERFRNAGIMVVWRPNISPDASYIYMERDLAILHELGMPPYIQIFNEPEVGQEWNEGEGEIRIKHFADNWMKFADTVYNAGGFPGLQVVDPETLVFLINRIKEKGKEYLFNEMFFVAHPYGSNHPPDYPYDANMQAREPDKTADQDWFCALGFLKYAHIFQAQLGFTPPIIIGEGGWTVTVHEDDKYPPVNLENHRDWHLEVFSWFKNNSLSNGEPLPDYLFSFNPWLIASGGEMVFDQASWYQSEQSGTKKLTIKGLERIPPFERKFSWN